MKILMVCLGNICRSPMAEGILRHMARERGITITTDSAGTSDYHVGEAPDRRAQAAMRAKGIDISDLRARQFTATDFDAFDLLLAMDADNLRNMLALAPECRTGRQGKPDDGPRTGASVALEVPDPYFGGDDGFDDVYAMLTEGHVPTC